jgi:hypothetical protein
MNKFIVEAESELLKKEKTEILGIFPQIGLIALI